MSEAAALKACCADLYAGDWARLLLGDSLHPGGVALTERLGDLLRLDPGARVLDVASGRGGSAIHIARRFGCSVLGVDYGVANVARALDDGFRAGLRGRVSFGAGDAERLPCADVAFDAVVCECAFCTFPDKGAAAAEMHRVLRPGWVAGLADLVRRGPLPSGLDDLLAWMACIADARPAEEYVRHLEVAGLELVTLEDHDEALVELVRSVRSRLLVAEVVARLRRMQLPGVDFESARSMARAAERAVLDGKLGYALILARRPRSSCDVDHAFVQHGRPWHDAGRPTRGNDRGGL